MGTRATIPAAITNSSGNTTTFTAMPGTSGDATECEYSDWSRCQSTIVSELAACNTTQQTMLGKASHELCLINTDSQTSADKQIFGSCCDCLALYVEKSPDAPAW